MQINTWETYVWKVKKKSWFIIIANFCYIFFSLFLTKMYIIEKLRHSRRHRWEPHKYLSNDKKKTSMHVYRYITVARECLLSSEPFYERNKNSDSNFTVLMRAFLTTYGDNTRNSRIIQENIQRYIYIFVSLFSINCRCLKRNLFLFTEIIWNVTSDQNNFIPEWPE